ncbi:MAG: hypothetical protein HOP37_11875, partial [Cyclobacteriaceae bacterium]|nr:hypothetical protein [Cyclobacteriaceae bacterium]
IKASAPVALIESALAEPVVAYSVCYPMGVIGMILAIILFQKIFKTSLKANAQLTDAEKLTNATVVVSNDKVIGSTLLNSKPRMDLKLCLGELSVEQLHFWHWTACHLSEEI